MVRTCVLSRTGGEASHVLTVSLTYVPPRTYRFTHVRTYVLTYVRTHLRTVRTYRFTHVLYIPYRTHTYVRTYRFTHVRTYLREYVRHVRTYVQFLPRTYVRPLFHLRTHVASCFGADGDGTSLPLDVLTEPGARGDQPGGHIYAPLTASDSPRCGGLWCAHEGVR